MSAIGAVESAELDRLAERLQEHFRAAAKRGYRTPDIESCRKLARYLEAIRDWPQLWPDPKAIEAEAKHVPAASPRRSYIPGATRLPSAPPWAVDNFPDDLTAIIGPLAQRFLPPDPEIDAVIKLGHGFLSAFLALAPKLDAILADWEDPKAAEALLRSCDEVLSHMIHVLTLLEANLAPTKDWCKALALGLVPWLTGQRVPDAIQIVAALARQAWVKANDVPNYPSNEKTAPLCKFVTAALSEIGIHTKPATVASILQGRRHRNKLVDLVGSIERALRG